MKAYTDLEQSKKLAEILPLESADMYFEPSAGFRTEPSEVRVGDIKHAHPRSVPCWSLAALLDVIPEGVIENYYTPNIQKENGKYSIAYGNEELLCEADTSVDACYEMIIKLNELKKL